MKFGSLKFQFETLSLMQQLHGYGYLLAWLFYLHLNAYLCTVYS